MSIFWCPSNISSTFSSSSLATFFDVDFIASSCTSKAYTFPFGPTFFAIYSGHEGGMEEKNAVYEFTQTLDQNYFNVLCTKFINQINNPPELLLIEKKG